jgi:hypothetical protein
VSDRAADVPRARLDNRGCTARHLEALSDIMDTCHSKADREGAFFSHTTTSTTILSHNIPNSVSPYQTCALLLTLNEVAKYMELGPHPRFKEQPPLAEDLRKENPRTTLRYWLQNNLKMEWAFKPKSQGRMSHR